MATIGISLAIPAGVGAGAASAVANMRAVKTIVVSGTFTGSVMLEARAAAGAWCQILGLDRTGKYVVAAACDELRVNRLSGSGAFTADVSAEEGIILSAALTVPAAAGAGASTNVSTFGQISTLFVGSPFTGVIAIENSADDTDYSQLSRSFAASGCQNIVAPTNFVRVRRTGAVLGAPTVSYAAEKDNLITPTDYRFVTGPATTLLPASPATNDVVVVKDITGLAESNPIVVGGNGNTIDGEDDWTLAVNWVSITLVFNGTEWNII